MDDLGSGYDVVMLFNIIHGLLPEASQELMHRAARALAPGGILVVLDQMAGGEFGTLLKASNRFWGLTYLMLLGGQVYTVDEVKSWLTTSGLLSVRRMSIMRGASSVLVGKKGSG